MIVNLGIYIVALLFGLVGLILPDFQLWPDTVLNGINSLTVWLLELNSIFLVIPVLLEAFVFFLKFLAYYFLYKITIKALNYLRGAGDGLT